MSKLHLTDREYYDVLRVRALGVIDEMRGLLDGHELENADGRFAPHVCAERMLKVAERAELIKLLAGAIT